MKSWKLLLITIGIASLLLSGCAQYKTSRIISQDQAQVAITLNKGYANSIIALNDGARIEPCIDPDVRQQKKAESTSLKECDPVGKGKILFEETYKVTAREGSFCISIWAGSHRYDFCDPPYNLQF
ncbi:MAG: hypothetical protein KZQ85_13500 [Candidatus Thiodiazotropha sp. (ex Myrtea sp. 'scaly one' KF741663)]|nr:hypothetical protein [Candidatus Thiodiazotropha sp. (ex Myrtea sp. 'scaly one' KF741663)]